MRVEVSIKGASFQIQCGKGNNSIQWIADCALVWLQSIKGLKCNENPAKITRNNGEVLDGSQIIRNTLDDGELIHIYMKADVELMELSK